MRSFFALLFACMFLPGLAQHCPWDCSGMILFKTTLPKKAVYAMGPVLVDENKHVITDSFAGAALDSGFESNFLYYNDFLSIRKEQFKTFYGYQYDTVYGFAEGQYLVRFNFCKYQDRKLYLRYKDMHTRDLEYHYIEIYASQRIHLHDYNDLLLKQDNGALKKELEHFVMEIW